MKRRLLMVGALIIGAGLAVGMVPAPSPSAPEAAAAASTYSVDSVHSSVMFRIMHMGVAPFYGRFNRISGTIDWNEENPESSSISITIPAESVSTANENRDNHLRSTDFFNAKEFPEISFTSSSIASRNGSTYEVKGDLTMHGETKPVTIELTRTGTGTHSQSGKKLIGFESIFTIQRAEFGMDYGVEQGVLGNDVKLMIGLEAAEQ